MAEPKKGSKSPEEARKNVLQGLKAIRLIINEAGEAPPDLSAGFVEIQDRIEFLEMLTQALGEFNRRQRKTIEGQIGRSDIHPYRIEPDFWRDVCVRFFVVGPDGSKSRPFYDLSDATRHGRWLRDRSSGDDPR